MSGLLNVIYEDHELLVINKPAGLVCHPTKTDEYSSLVGRVRLYLGEAERFHLVNRLDRETSGVVIVSKEDQAARELRRLWESRAIDKEYLAIVHGHVWDDSGSIDAPLGKDELSRVVIKDCVRPEGVAARTEFTVVRRFQRNGGSRGPGMFSLLRLRLWTGRKHQIRIHLSHIGHPIVGDKLYGGNEELYLALVEDRLTAGQREELIFSNHALHARALRFDRGGESREFACDPESWFTEFLEAGPVW